jgi:hypothetical protein
MIQRGSIKQGLAFLEENYGRYWYNDIDLEVLDIGSSCYCLIGQLEGCYDNVFPMPESLSGREYGFMGETWKDDERLTARWKKEIRKLRRLEQ